MTIQNEIRKETIKLRIEMRNIEGDLIWRIIILAMALVPVTVFLGISLISLALR